MKTILLILGLATFTVTTGHAQNKNCSCKKVAHHRVATHKTANRTAALPDNYALGKNEQDETGPVCYSYRQHNIVVTECPAIFYANSDAIEFKAENTYSGYYPKAATTNPPPQNSICTDQRVAPGKMVQQHTKVIEQCDGAPLPEPDFYLWDKPKR